MPEIGPDYKLFMQFMGEQAQNATQNVQYALGSKSVDIPMDADLMSRFLTYRKEKLPLAGPIPKPQSQGEALDMAEQLGFMSTTGRKTGVIHCRVSYPAGKIDTAGVVPLAREMEAHAGLIINATQKALEGSNGAQNDVRSAALNAIKEDVLGIINRSILIDQINWLSEKNKSSVNTEMLSNDNETLIAAVTEQYNIYIKGQVNGHEVFNQFLASKRLDYAKKMRDQIFKQLYYHHILTSTETTEKRFWKTSQSDAVISQIMNHLPSVPSSYTDNIFQNSSNGQYASQTASAFVAHDKQLGRDKLGLMRIVLDNGKVIWRVPSIAATDAYRKEWSVKYNEEKYVQDAKDKFNYMASQMSDTQDYINYNLLTSYGCTPAYFTDNHQTWSTQIILKGMHAYNRDKVRGYAEAKNLVLLCNLSVNQWGKDKPSSRWTRMLRGPIDEIHDMVDLSILQLLNTYLGTDNDVIREAANVSMKEYKKYLSKSNAEAYYTNSAESDVQAESIMKMRASGLTIEVKDGDSINQRIAKVILKMFMNNTYCKKEYGMLVQAMMIAAENNKIVGCKSANERFASVVDKSVVVDHPKFQMAMDNFIKGAINEDQLYANMLVLYNDHVLYEGPGTQCSLTDQAALPKVKTFETGIEQPAHDEAATNNGGQIQADDDAFTCGSKTYDTNAFEHPVVTNLHNEHAKALQAHKTAELVQQSFHEVTSLEVAKNALLTNLVQYNKEQDTKKGEKVSAVKQKERDFKSRAGTELMDYLKIVIANMPPSNPTEMENIMIAHNAILRLQSALADYPTITRSNSKLPDMIKSACELCFKFDQNNKIAEIPDEIKKLGGLIRSVAIDKQSKSGRDVD